MDQQPSMSREVSGSWYQWPAAYQQPSMSRLSADIREPGVTVSHLRLMSRPCLLLVVMHPYRWSRTDGA